MCIRDSLLGSGPFKVTEWVPNDHYTLVRNDNYWGEMPIATSITCRVIPEGSARTIALEAVSYTHLSEAEV